MDSIRRFRNLTVLVVVLMLQVLGLAFQVKVKRTGDSEPTRLIRLWSVGLFAPVEKAVVHGGDRLHNFWNGYFYLRAVRQENEKLSEENTRLRLAQVRIAEDAGQAQRLQALLKFKEQFISQTVAAQVIGSSGSDSAHLIYIDKGLDDGLKVDMPVISPTGVVGKIIRAFPSTSQVLEINDQTSGIGAILERARLQGILRGTATGEAMLHYVMSDEKVPVGERVLTSGGDGIYPKGLPIGTVVAVDPGKDVFLNIRVKPEARLDRLEEVLVITQVDERQPEMIPEAPKRASDILAERLPTVPVKPPDAVPGGAPAAQNTQPSGTPASKPAAGGGTPKPTATAPAKPATAASTATTAPSTGATVANQLNQARPQAPQTAGAAIPSAGKKTTPVPATEAQVPAKPKTKPAAKPAPQAQITPFGVRIISDMDTKPATAAPADNAETTTAKRNQAIEAPAPH